MTLFERPTPSPVTRSQTLREIDQNARPKWTAHRPKKRMPCDECILVLHEAGGVGPYARSARWRRSMTGQPTLFLCDEHKRLHCGEAT
jgi:hypothetical protein